MTEQAPFPVVTVEGGPYELGYQYGTKCRTLIEKMLATYQSFFKTEAKLEWGQVTVLSAKFIPFIESYDPDALEEMKGIAKGVERPVEEIVALNSRSEISFMALSGTKLAADAGGCTALVATTEATHNGHTLIGQNWDWLPQVQETLIILKKRKKGKPGCITFTEAGLLGRGGLNAAGLGFVGNGLVTDQMRVGVPVGIMTNKMLSVESLTEAMGAVFSAHRAGSTNRLVATSRGECVDIEVAVDNYNVLFPEAGLLAHTNHFTVPVPGVKDLMPVRYPNSYTRLFRAKKLLAAERGNITVETFQRIFTDHLGKPDSICWHTNEKVAEKHRLQTDCSVIMDLTDTAFYIAKGPPCENEYVAIDLKDVV